MTIHNPFYSQNPALAISMKFGKDNSKLSLAQKMDYNFAWVSLMYRPKMGMPALCLNLFNRDTGEIAQEQYWPSFHRNTLSICNP